MMKFATFALLNALILCVLGQGFTTNPGTLQPRSTIDNFRIGTNLVTIITSGTTVFPAINTNIYTDPSDNPAGLVGGERDLQLTVIGVSTPGATRVLSSSVGLGEWEVSTPGGASGTVLLQIDGKDNAATLSTNRLTPLDITVGGTARAFNITLDTDIATEFTFSVYNSNGNRCEQVVTIPDGNGIPVNYYLPYNQFSGNCVFTSVTAFEIFVEAFVNVDAIAAFFGTVGDPVSPTPSNTRTPTPSNSPDPTVSRTPTPSPLPSGTRTPTPTPTPSPTPSPAPSQDCMCHCPVFTCALIFDPDDDENDVYYFDDDDENNGVQGGSNADYQEASSATSVTISTLAVIIAIVAFIY